jgi:hypothetical protein
MPADVPPKAGAGAIPRQTCQYTCKVRSGAGRLLC